MTLNTTNLPLQKRKILKKTLENCSIIVLVQLFGVLPITLVFASSMQWVVMINTLLFFLSFMCIYFYQVLYFHSYFYEFAPDQAHIQKGVISRATGYVRYERIQNLYVDQDILDRLFGLYDVHYETAGDYSSNYSHVDGLNKENANSLLAFLQEQVSHGMPSQVQKKSVPELEKTQSPDVQINKSTSPISKKLLAKRMLMDTTYSTLLVVLLFYQFFIAYGFIILAGIILFILMLSYVYEKIWFDNYVFEFSNRAGMIRTRVISLSETHVNYDRIQNVNVIQGILDRLFDIFSVQIETAADSMKNSAKQKRLLVSGLTQEQANYIKGFLVEQASLYNDHL